MRGNWDQMEPRTLAPEQDQQLLQQQQAMPATQSGQVQEQQATQLPPAQPKQQQQQQQAASTTPGWDKIVVKDEPADDKNNDSGIWPGHYTSGSGSPQSRQSPRTASNGSNTPESMVSHDSNDVQTNVYHKYRPQSTTPPMMDFQATLDYANARLGQQPPVQAPRRRPNFPVNVETVTSVEALGFELPEQLDYSSEPLECPVCPFKTLRRIVFSEHIRTHCPVAAELCRPYEFSRSLVKQLLGAANINNIDRIAPTLEDYDLIGTSDHDFRTPKLSQNKVKVYRCKQCGFVAMSKVDYWRHTRQHIKPEKLLTCPHCSFITEYKHHLEYHLRNHFKSKPYKCDKCTYACVNKSMLNSHLKSHSTVYQFRCCDCSYATKYCHSLKLHLRKYDHQPAMVLNPDGSPNPLPIIDVYGTRRGPKAKPRKEDEPQPSTSSAPVAVAPMQQPQPQPQPQLQPFQFNPLNGFQGFNGQALPSAPALLGFPYNPIFAGFPMGNPFDLKARLNAMGQMLSEAGARSPPAPESYFNVNAKPATVTSQDLIPIVKLEEYEPNESSDPLDLSKPENTAQDLSANATQAPEAVASTSAAATTSSATPVKSPKDSRANRRKGRAYRVDRHFVGYNDGDEEMPQEAQRSSPPESLEVQPPICSPASTSGDSKESHNSKESHTSKESNTSSISNDFVCHYCDISFGNEVMHSVHMGYHGCQNPFTCNMCGLPCTDKVTFFLHIARVKH
ncbi:hunchback isoform A [Nasonia vitripennis]|nr:hunchback isoform A [Nasonia vitripennis]AAZ20145.1 hunchback splice variant A [Nasonia vitripennis]AAZ20147.1 hunchback splice variant A [Nasonia vitripennis]